MRAHDNTNKHTHTHTSSGTALMLVKPFRKTTNTLRAPQRRAEVAQSNAVSPAPKTMTLPWREGSTVLQLHIPEGTNERERKRKKEREKQKERWRER